MSATQARYFIRAGLREAERAFAALELAFEEEGAPVAMTETDEPQGVREVSVYLAPAGTDRAAELRAALGGDEGLEIGREEVPDIDWMAQVLSELKPVRAGRFVVHGAHDRASIGAGDLAIEIEAGQAFGTGHHGSTTGCLMMIERVVRRRRPRSALDVGTGSAVLAIAIAKLAGITVLASDIDPVAVAVARENVLANGVRAKVRVVTAAGLDAAVIRREKPFDLIVANILAGPLTKLAPALATALTPGGDIILSGILQRQRGGVLAAYRAQGLHHRRTIRLEEWVTLHLSR